MQRQSQIDEAKTHNPMLIVPDISREAAGAIAQEPACVLTRHDPLPSTRSGQSEGLLPLGDQYNPVHYVKGIESRSDDEAAVLTPEQTLRVLEQLQQPEYTMLVLVAATEMRMSEMLGLRWADISGDRGEIRIRRTYVDRELETGAKTRLSKSTVAMHDVLGQLL
jgi:integrase